MNLVTSGLCSKLSVGGILNTAFTPAVVWGFQHTAARGYCIKPAGGPRAAQFTAASGCHGPAAAVPATARLPWCTPQTRGFAASNSSATAAPAMTGLDDIVAQVVTCAAENKTESGILAKLADTAMNAVKELTPEQIRNLCVSFSQLGYFDTTFKSVMADAVVDKLDQFQPHQLADTAWAFGEAQYYDFDLMSHLLPYLKANAERFDASGMAKMLWAFGRFGYQDETLLGLMKDIALKLQANCSTKSLAEVVYAMAQMGWADMKLHQLIADYAMDHIKDFDAPSLAKLAYGLAAVGYDDEDLYTAITQEATAALSTMSPADVALILWACGEEGHMCEKFMKAVADEYLPENIDQFTPQQLQTAVVAWNKLGFTSPAVAVAAVRLSELLPHMTPEFPDCGTPSAPAVGAVAPPV